MAYAVGANTRLAFKKEATYGTSPGGTDWLQLPFIPRLELGATQNLLDSNVIGIGPTRDPSDPFYDGIEAGGSFSVPLDKTEFGRWLHLALGAPQRTISASSGCGFLPPVVSRTILHRGCLYALDARIMQ